MDSLKNVGLSLGGLSDRMANMLTLEICKPRASSEDLETNPVYDLVLGADAGCLRSDSEPQIPLILL